MEYGEFPFVCGCMACNTNLYIPVCAQQCSIVEGKISFHAVCAIIIPSRRLFLYVDFVLACFIKLYCALTKCLAVMCFETTNNTRIKWLYKQGQIWLKEYNAYVSWFIANCVTTEIVDEKTDMVARLPHLDVKGLYPSN